MPVQPLFNAFIERLINTALAEDPTAPQRLKTVRGKTFRLQVTSWPWPLTLTFSDDRVMLMGSTYEAIDGEVSASLQVLMGLTDASKVTAALQRGEMTLSGDPIFAQQASQVLLGLQIDWEEALAQRFGDVPGYWLSQGIARLNAKQPNLTSWRTWFSDTLSEEKKLTVGQLEYNLFIDELGDLIKRVSQLENRKS